MGIFSKVRHNTKFQNPTLGGADLAPTSHVDRYTAMMFP
jgi:hypothetical protein